MLWIDSEINIASVETPEPEKKTFLEKVFGPKDKDEKKEDKENGKEESSEEKRKN